MGVNDVQIRISASDAASSVMRGVGNQAERTAGQINTLGSAVSRVVFNSAGVAAGIAGYNGLAAAVQNASNMIFNFSKSMETNEIGMSGILISMTEINGRQLQWNEAIGISKSIMKQLNDEALRTAATSEELVTTFRGILAPGLAAKMTISEIVQLTSTGVNAVKSLGLNNTQLVQELRDLVQGGIQPASSTLATSLGLKDKDIAAAKQSSEGLFKFLMDRLKGFEIASAYTQSTFAGKMDQITEGITRAGAQGTAPLFQATKNLLGEIADQILIVDQTAKTVDLNPQLVSSLTTISNSIIYISENAKTVGIAFGTWYAVSRMAGIYTDIIAVTNGATVANTMLGRSVLGLMPAYQQKAVAASYAAAVDQASNAAAMSGYTRLSLQLLDVREQLIAMGVTAEQANITMLQSANLASAGYFKMSESILATSLAQAEAARRAQIMGTTTVGASTAARSAVAALGSAVFGLIGGWIGVAAAIGYAIYALGKYNDKKAGMVDSYNPEAKVFEEKRSVWVGGSEKIETFYTKATDKTEQIIDPITGDVSYRDTREELSGEELKKHLEYKRMKSGDFGLDKSFVDPRDITVKDFGTGAGNGKGAERAYEEAQKLNDKLADMMAKMDEKILAETSTTFGLGTQKLKDEIANMNRELAKEKIDLAKYGISTDGVESKIKEYEKMMQDKLVKEQSRALRSFQQETLSVTAKITDNKKAAADAEYQATLLSLEKQWEEKEKVTQNEVELANWYNAQVALAEKKRLDAHIDANIQQYDLAVQNNNTLMVLQNKSKLEIDALNRKELTAKIEYLDKELSKTKITEAERLRLRKESVDAMLALEEIGSRDQSTAVQVALKRAGRDYTDWGDIAYQSIKRVDQAFEDNIAGILSQTETFSGGMRNIFKSMIDDITKMMAKMWYQQTIMAPVQSWWSGVLGGLLGGNSTVGVSENAAIDAALANGSANIIATNIPGHAAGGYYGGGLALVGEEGPELINFRNSGRVYTAGQTKNILSSTSTPNVQVNVINNTSNQVKVSKKAQFDSETGTTMITMVMEAIDNNVAGSRDYFFARG